MTKNKKAGARALSCACALALAASMAPAAALAWAGTPGTDTTASNVQVKVVTDDPSPVTLLEQYVKLPASGVTPDVKAVKGTQSWMTYASSAWTVSTTTEYVPLSDILKDAGADAYWNEDAKSIHVYQLGTDAPASSYIATWEQYKDNQNWYPATSSTAPFTDVSAKVPVTPGVALKWVDQEIGDNSAAGVAVTSARLAQSANTTAIDNAGGTSGYTFFHGLAQGDYTAASPAGTAAAGTYPAAASSKPLVVKITVPGASGSTQRIYGQTWADTMSQTMHYNKAYQPNTVKNFVIATAGGYQDALSAAGLAGSVGAAGTANPADSDAYAPILMTEANALTPQTAELLNYYGARSGDINIYVVGGKNAVSEEVVSAIKSLDVFSAVASIKVNRLSGAEAWDTALAVYNHIKGNADKTKGWKANAADIKSAVICTSGGFQDALSVAPYAYATGTPIVLTNNDNVLDDTAAKLMGRLDKAYVIGGRKAVAAEVTDSQLLGVSVKRIYGETCYDTSNQVATELYDTTGAFGNVTAFNNANGTTVAVATGEDYLDALASSAYCGNLGTVGGTTAAMPLLLVSNSDTTTIDGFLTANAANNTANNGHFTSAKVFGGSAAVSAGVVESIRTALL